MELPKIDVRTIGIGAMLGALLIGFFLILTTGLGLRSGFYGVPPYATPWSHGYDTLAATAAPAEHSGGEH